MGKEPRHLHVHISTALITHTHINTQAHTTHASAHTLMFSSCMQNIERIQILRSYIGQFHLITSDNMMIKINIESNYMSEVIFRTEIIVFRVTFNSFIIQIT